MLHYSLLNFGPVQDHTRLKDLILNLNKCLHSTVYCVDSSPGPQYHVDAKFTRFGKDGTPAYSMLGRMKAQRKFPLMYQKPIFSFSAYFFNKCSVSDFELLSVMAVWLLENEHLYTNQLFLTLLDIQSAAATENSDPISALCHMGLTVSVILVSPL